MKKINQSGFGAVEILISLVVVGIIAGAGWFVWQNNQNNNQNSSDVDTTESSQESQEVQTVERTGTFVDVGEKTGSGGATVIEEADGTQTVRLEENFKVQKGPALYVAFSNNGKFAKGTDFAELKALSGEQEYTVPNNIDASDYDQVMIWCEEFAVAFAVADLK